MTITVLDNMEYGSDAAAQAAYCGTVDIGSPPIDRGNAGTPGYSYIDTANPCNLNGKITTIELWFKTNATGVKVGTFYGSGGSYTLRDYETIGNVTAGSKQSFSVDIDAQPGDFIGMYMATGGMAFSTTGGTVLYYLAGDNFSSGAKTYTALSGYAVSLYGYSIQDEYKAYSESTTITEGSYSLKAIASQTTSLNKTLIRTISTPINLTGHAYIIGKIRSSRTGSNIKIGFHDSGGTTTEITPNITSADTWQLIQFDISSVPDADKDAIDQIIITVVNADADNTFYLDNFFAADATDFGAGTQVSKAIGYAVLMPIEAALNVSKVVGYAVLIPVSESSDSGPMMWIF